MCGFCGISDGGLLFRVSDKCICFITTTTTIRKKKRKNTPLSLCWWYSYTMCFPLLDGWLDTCCTQQDRMYTTLGLCFLIYFLSFFSCLLMDMYGPDGPRHFFWLFAISYLMHSGEHTVNVYYRYDTTLFFRPHNRRLMDGDRRRRRSQEKNTK